MSMLAKEDQSQTTRSTEVEGNPSQYVNKELLQNNRCRCAMPWVRNQDALAWTKSDPCFVALAVTFRPRLPYSASTTYSWLGV